MKATKYFRTKGQLTSFAKEFKKMHPLNWYIRTTLECDHAVINKRRAIVLIANEKVEQRIILCPICNQHGNSINVEPQTQTHDSIR